MLVLQLQRLSKFYLDRCTLVFLSYSKIPTHSYRKDLLGAGPDLSCDL
jgi:hypothetical protein